MRNLILAAVAVAAVSFASSTAMARHFHHHHRGPVRHYAVPHHVYRHAPVYSSRHHAYHVPPYQQYHHGYHYARPGYASGGIGVNGPHFSFYIGF